MWNASGTQASAAFLAELIAAMVTSPADIFKTRVMSSTAAGTPGLGGVMRDAFKNEGVMWMFKRWVPSFSRIGR